MPPPADVVRKTVNNGNGLDVSYLEAGPRDGPLVVFVHGFPELAECWTAQLAHFGARGWWAVAYDQRGYGETTGWDETDIQSCDAYNLAKDCAGFILSLGSHAAFLVGHDFGTTTVFYTALYRPDLVKGVCCMGIPLGPVPTAMKPNAGASMDRAFAKLRKRGLIHYQDAMILPETEAEMARDLRGWLAKTYYVSSGLSPWKVSAAKGKLYPMILPLGELMTSRIPDGEVPQLNFIDIDAQTAQFKKTGMRAAVNWYRNVGRNVDLLQLFAGSPLRMPYAFIAGEHDFCVQMYPDLYARIEKIPGFKFKALIKDAGHWVQQERPQETCVALEKFLTAALRDASQAHL
eukprot:TRINITY_DN19668_c0_g1_i1.p2 TRINITY_DN19668_c0_g1~~TRINITY_DN19668_c0_g1_i1.p2  ORF type:complete len:347 (+),score=92.48 TRINITY_DN19668_c0_g1_i1:187-1227(+)